MSFAKLVLAASSLEALPMLVHGVLPPKETAVTLIQDCLASLLELYPVLSDTAAFGALSACYQKDTSCCSAFDFWNTHVLLAIALMSQSRKRGDEQYESGLVQICSAMRHAQYVLQPGSIAGIQASLLLVRSSPDDISR